MELAQFITNEQVGGSSPLALSKILRLRSSMDLEHRSSKPEVARSSRAGAKTNEKWKTDNEKFERNYPFFIIFRVRLTAGRIALNDET